VEISTSSGSACTLLARREGGGTGPNVGAAVACDSVVVVVVAVVDAGAGTDAAGEEVGSGARSKTHHNKKWGGKVNDDLQKVKPN